MANSLSGLYPQPPQPGQGLLGDPLRLLGALGQVQQIQRFGSEQNALSAYRDALGANGVADPGALVRGLQGNGATFGAPEVMSQALAQRGQGINNDISSLHLAAGQNEFITNKIASLANSPKVSPEDILALKPVVARVLDPSHASSAAINVAFDQVLKDPQGIRHGLTTLQNQILGAGAATRIIGPPDASGAETSTALGTAGYGAPQGPTPATGARSPATAAPGTMPIGLAPGTPEYLNQSAAEGTGLLHSVQDLPNQKALLENIDALGREATSGPSADFEQRLNALALRWLGHGITLTPGETAAGEGYNKLVNQIATAQATAAHATDSYLQTAFHANPGLSLSKQGREAMIPILKGNLDAQNFKANAFQNFLNGGEDGQRHNANEYYDWSNRFNKVLNPRVFQLQNMNADQQAEYLRLLTPADKRQLLSSFQFYEKKGWIPKRGEQQQ